MLWFLDIEMLENEEAMLDNGAKKVSEKSPVKKSERKSGCACGRKVCCGKHKNGQCACHRGRERD